MDTPIPSSAYKNRSVLITGGLGFIGSTLARRLVELGGVTVRLLDAMLEEQGGTAFNVQGIEDRVTVYKADLRDRDEVASLVCDTDYIFNLAGSVSHVDSMNYPQQDLELNCRAQLVLVDACRRHNRGCKIVLIEESTLAGLDRSGRYRRRNVRPRTSSAANAP